MEKNKTTKGWLKLSAIVMIFTMILSFSGCIRYKTTATVHQDGTVDVEILYAVIDSAENAQDISGGTVDWETIRSKSELGWTVEEYYDDSGDYPYRGYILSKEGIAMEALPDEMIATNLGFDGFTLSKEGETYIMNWDSSGATSGATSGGSSSDGLESMDGYMKFILQVPGAVESDNATSRRGKTLEWNLIETPAPFCKFKLTGGGLPIWAIILIGAGIVGGIVAVVIVLVNKKKNKFIPTYRTQEELDAIFPDETSDFPVDPLQWEAEKHQSPFARPVSETEMSFEENGENVPADQGANETYHYENDVLKPDVPSPIWARPLSEEERNALGNPDDTEM